MSDFKDWQDHNWDNLAKIQQDDKDAKDLLTLILANRNTLKDLGFTCKIENVKGNEVYMGIYNNRGRVQSIQAYVGSTKLIELIKQYSLA